MACGLALGPDPQSDTLEAVSRTPRYEVEAAVLRALQQPPCLVSFSGGRDSSAVLAVAAELARRHGLTPPLPTTYRFANAPGSVEDEWQEEVVRHVAVPHWERVPMTTEIDTVGPVAQQALRRHGLVWPFNAHFHLPLLERANGGTLLTGIGGDELFGTYLWSSARRLLGSRARGQRVRAGSAMVAFSPRLVRRAALSHRHRQRWPWMRPGAEAAVKKELVDWRSRVPVGWNGGVAWWWRSRYRTMLSATMAALAAGTGTRIVHPFLEPSVVGAAVGHFGRPGPLDRSAALRELFGDLLPDTVLTRRSKAHFNDAFMSDHTRAFAAAWTGGGVDESIVDPERLAAEWQSANPDPRSLLLMQAAWLAHQDPAP